MKYIGENAIKKLISLIKGDLATKQDSIAATGVLERDTAGVINGVETVGATLVETQEATLVDVPNGLLKGDGTTISQAVAGTDYVNSSQAIRYDAAQTLTDAQKTQARGNIGAVPAGFGYGEVKYTGFWDDEDGTKLEQDLDSKFAPGSMRSKVFRTAFVDYPICPESGNGGFADILADSTNDSNGYPKAITIVFYARNVGAIGPTIATKQKIDGTWYPWEYVNPPMQFGVEYRTTERYQGKPVYIKLVDFGALPNNTEKSVSVGVDHNIIKNLAIDLSKSTTHNQSDEGTSLLPLATGIANIHPNNGCVLIRTSTDRSNWTGKICVKYTKTTD